MSAMVINARMYSVTPAAKAAWQTLFDWVLARAGVKGNWVPHDPPLLISDLWERDDLACVMMCGLPFSRRTPKPTLLAAPISSAPRYGGRSVYATDLAVRADATLTTLEDTFGGIAGFTVPDSQSGYYAFRHHLLTKHADQPAPYRAYVGRLLNARGIIQALADRRIDVGPLDGYVFDLIRASDPVFAAQVKVVVTTDPTPMPPVIATTALAPAAIESLRAAFLAVGNAPELAATRSTLLLDRFILPAPGDFDVQRTRAALVDAAGKHWE
ncbi:MAG: PhnD/SsuA/transferrin family substrate-binding protein [Burkholderiales bacterium]